MRKSEVTKMRGKVVLFAAILGVCGVFPTTVQGWQEAAPKQAPPQTFQEAWPAMAAASKPAKYRGTLLIMPPTKADGALEDTGLTILSPLYDHLALCAPGGVGVFSAIRLTVFDDFTSESPLGNTRTINDRAQARFAAFTGATHVLSWSISVEDGGEATVQARLTPVAGGEAATTTISGRLDEDMKLAQEMAYFAMQKSGLAEGDALKPFETPQNGGLLKDSTKSFRMNPELLLEALKRTPTDQTLRYLVATSIRPKSPAEARQWMELLVTGPTDLANAPISEFHLRSAIFSKVGLKRAAQRETDMALATRAENDLSYVQWIQDNPMGWYNDESINMVNGWHKATPKRPIDNLRMAQALFALAMNWRLGGVDASASPEDRVGMAQEWFGIAKNIMGRSLGEDATKETYSAELLLKFLAVSGQREELDRVYKAAIAANPGSELVLLGRLFAENPALGGSYEAREKLLDELQAASPLLSYKFLPMVAALEDFQHSIAYNDEAFGSLAKGMAKHNPKGFARAKRDLIEVLQESEDQILLGNSVLLVQGMGDEELLAVARAIPADRLERAVHAVRVMQSGHVSRAIAEALGMSPDAAAAAGAKTPGT